MEKVSLPTSLPPPKKRDEGRVSAKMDIENSEVNAGGDDGGGCWFPFSLPYLKVSVLAVVRLVPSEVLSSLIGPQGALRTRELSPYSILKRKGRKGNIRQCST